MREFRMPCGPTCHQSGHGCLPTCTKVYKGSYLNTDHWDAVIKLLGKHCFTGKITLDSSNYCVRVVDLEWSDNGVVLGNASGTQRLTVARENGNHFIPVLRSHAPVHGLTSGPW